MEIIFRRIKKYLKINTNNLSDLMKILTFRWSIEGWKYHMNQISESEVYIEINECPYKEIMERNPKRLNKIPLICRDMCIPFYKAIVGGFNPEIEIKRKKFMGLGNKICNFHFKLVEH